MAAAVAAAWCLTLADRELDVLRCGFWSRELHAQDLARPHRTAAVGDIERPIGTNRNRGGEDQSSEHGGSGSSAVPGADVALALAGSDTYQDTRPALLHRPRRVLEHVQVSQRVEGDVEDRLEAADTRLVDQDRRAGSLGSTRYTFARVSVNGTPVSSAT